MQPSLDDFRKDDSTVETKPYGEELPLTVGFLPRRAGVAFVGWFEELRRHNGTMVWLPITGCSKM